MLLRADADINEVAGNRASVLVLAVHSAHRPFAEFLLERGADPNARLKRGTPGRRASEDWMLKARYVSATPFWLAALFREPEIIRMLADGRADPVLTTRALWRPRRRRGPAGGGRRFRHTDDGGGAGHKRPGSLRDGDPRSHAGGAARNLKTVVRFFGERGASLDVRNSMGRTPLDVAQAGARRGSVLVGRGPDWSSPNAVDVLLELGAIDGADSGR